jgi:hypothetical protein
MNEMFFTLLQDCRATVRDSSPIRSSSASDVHVGKRWLSCSTELLRPGIHSADFQCGPGRNYASPASLTKGAGHRADGIPLSITVRRRAFGSSFCRQQGDAAMSKSFELMRRQMAKKLDVLPEQNLVPCFVRTKRRSYARITRLDLDAATPEEYRKLAENIFRSRGKKSPHVVTFPGIAFRKSRSRMSSHPCGLADALHMKGWIRDFAIPGCPENLWLSSLGSVWHGICQPSSGVARR